jgi:hypothetical protein
MDSYRGTDNLDPRSNKMAANDKVNPIALLNGKKDDETVWVENMLDGFSVFRGRDDNKYEMEAHGMEGSLISIPAKVLRGHTYLIRKISEGKIKLLTDKEASARQGELVATDYDVNNATPLKNLEKGASTADRFTVSDLPSDGEERQSISARQVWDSNNPKTAAPSTVRRSGSAGEEPVELPNVVVTERVTEGEWQSDTGV